MNYLSLIYNALTSATANPVAPVQMAQMQEPPFVVFNIDNIDPLSTKHAVPCDLVTVSVMVFNQNLDNLQTDADAIRSALTCLSTVQSSWMDFAGIEYNEITKQYYMMQMYSLRIPRTAPENNGIGVMIIGSTFIVA